ncbi:hypothetical protein [Yimella lutea]|nr:hypothetical protein [Yimella lutea]
MLTIDGWSMMPIEFQVNNAYAGAFGSTPAGTATCNCDASQPVVP